MIASTAPADIVSAPVAFQLICVSTSPFVEIVWFDLVIMNPPAPEKPMPTTVIILQALLQCLVDAGFAWLGCVHCAWLDCGMAYARVPPTALGGMAAGLASDKGRLCATSFIFTKSPANAG